jgi:hypothetical protein
MRALMVKPLASSHVALAALSGGSLGAACAFCMEARIFLTLFAGALLFSSAIWIKGLLPGLLLTALGSKGIRYDGAP